MSNIAHELEDRIMDCWNVTSDIKLTYEEYLDSPESMSEDELSNILIGIEYLYNRKFQRLWQTFEEVCDHGGIWLDKKQVKTNIYTTKEDIPSVRYNDIKEHKADDEHTEAMEQARLRKLGSSAYQRAGAMEQARLRRMQDSAAGRKPDIQNMSSDGLYERSMKQKYGRAVMTVSEMMKEELEPLHINTFE